MMEIDCRSTDLKRKHGFTCLMLSVCFRICTKKSRCKSNGIKYYWI